MWIRLFCKGLVMKQGKIEFKDVVEAEINKTEKKLLREFVDMVRADTYGCNARQRMREGKELLNLVRRRALEDAKGEANLIILEK